MGTLLDTLHVWNGAASYPPEKVWTFPGLGVAWYVPLEFMVAGAVVVTVRPELDEGLDRAQTDIALNTVVWGLAGLTLAWWGSGYLTSHGVPSSAASSVLTLFALGMWAIFDSTRQGAIAAGITAVIGVAVESAIARTGTYRYTNPDLGLVPQWLPSLYITACVAVGNLGRYMKYSWSPAAELELPSGSAPRKAA